MISQIGSNFFYNNYFKKQKKIFKLKNEGDEIQFQIPNKNFFNFICASFLSFGYDLIQIPYLYENGNEYDSNNDSNNIIRSDLNKFFYYKNFKEIPNDELISNVSSIKIIIAEKEDERKYILWKKLFHWNYIQVDFDEEIKSVNTLESFFDSGTKGYVFYSKSLVEKLSKNKRKKNDDDD